MNEQIGQFSETFANISLRDYFAGQALPTVMQASDVQQVLAWDEWAKAVAKASYDVADAMLAERAK